MPLPEFERVHRIQREHLAAGLLNVVVFGPGRGESCVVRLPNGELGVVDGCRKTNDPTLALLESLRGPDSRLAFVALTHPHEDHYGGLAELLDRWSGQVGEVWRTVYGPRYAKQLLRFVSAQRAGKPGLLPDESRSNELRDVLSAFEDVWDTGTGKQLIVGRSLFKCAIPDGHPVEVTAWGPADRDNERHNQALVRAVLARSREDTHPSVDPNQASGALLVQWGEARILLAGDLLCGTRPDSGWRAARSLADRPVQVVNVAHHASEEAHDEELWGMMAPQLAIVTPFKGAVGKQPPRPEMIKTLCASAAVVITSPPRWAEEASQHGLRVVPAAGPSTPPRPSEVKLKNAALAGHATPAPSTSAFGAVAVALDHTGKIRRVVLSSEATRWEADPV